ncbi:MAG: hypothetical protein ACOX6I_04850 [Syntrophomonadaceae bacterium]|jgi:stage III sporulation protein AG
MLDEWIRDFTGKGQQGSERLNVGGKKGKYVLVILICLGLLALIWPDSEAGPQKPAAGISPEGTTSSSTIKSKMTAELETILSAVNGAGVVKVSLTLTSDGVKNYATNVREERRDTEEKDTKGVQKKITELSTVKDLAVSGGDSLMVEQKYPEVVGVLVVADGASDPVIKEELTEATITLLNIPPDRVKVLARARKEEG